MGWTTTYKPKGEPALDFFNRAGVFTWSGDSPHTHKVLDSALVKFNTFYAAVEKIHKETGERKVWAAVILIRHYNKKNGKPYWDHNFGWKDMDESCGPNADECPERILKLLTPTTYEHAIDWRARCWANIEKRKARKNLTPGTTLKYGKYEMTVLGPAICKTRVLVRDQHEKVWTMTRSQILKAEIVKEKS